MSDKIDNNGNAELKDALNKIDQSLSTEDKNLLFNIAKAFRKYKFQYNGTVEKSKTKQQNKKIERKQQNQKNVTVHK